jgi:hypothetical protein
MPPACHGVRTLACLLALAATLVLAPGAWGATVTSTADSGAGSLRAAVDAAAAGEAITFGPGLGAITLSSPVDVDTPVAIQDPENDAEVRGSAGPLLRFVSGSAGSSVRGVRLLATGGAGVAVGAGIGPIAVRAAPAVLGEPPLALGAGANGGIVPPPDLRVARGSAGGLVVSGTAGVAGGLDVYRGNPAAGSGAAFGGELPVPAGPFSAALPFDAASGDLVAATLTGASEGTSAFATVRVPGDLVAPRLLGAVAVSQTQVRVRLSEPVDPASVAPADFALRMGTSARALAGAALGADGATVLLSAPRAWRGGEAGTVALSAPGAVLDGSGNESGAPEAVRVAAAPGDVLEPLASALRVRPRALCLTRGRRCRRAGALVRFVASEESRVTFVLQRGNRRVGVRKYDARAGSNTIRFNGRVKGRKLRQGVYRLLVYLEDAVGNQTSDPPLQRFTIRRVTG